MKKVLIIFGTRPEAIKLSPIIKKMENGNIRLCVKVCVTGQHRGMLDQVLNIFDISPDYDLDIMRENQSLFDITVKGLKRIEKVLKREKPDIILVQGDTTTTFVASLAGYYSRIKIGHIEAGLRTNDKFNPFPEEANRKIIDYLADFYFAPTQRAKQNLLKEGLDRGKIFVTGNTGIDALLMIVRGQRNRRIRDDLEKRFSNRHGIYFDKRKIVLVTGHRRESFGVEFENICLAVKKIAKSNRNVQIIYPVHLNPDVQKPVRRILTGMKNVYLINPLDYFSFVWLMNRSYLILTDSGGIQEEAPSLGKPVLVMRDKTERLEGIEAGNAKLVGTNDEIIFSETTNLLNDNVLYRKMASTTNPYGDGKASDRIIGIITGKVED